MTPERWRRVNDLFHAALERPEAERAGFLRTAAGDDDSLAADVRSLLDTHLRRSDFLEQPAWGVAADLILDDQALTGRQIGPYRVGEEIGRGGMGVVYAAEDTRLGRAVALKALAPAYGSDERRRARLAREARAAAALSHPNIATVFALEEVDGALYIVSELVRGRTLREELQDGALAPPLLLPTLCDVASALAAAHARGIVHRDLKPENVIRRADGQIKILDFGLARMTGDNEWTHAQVTEVGVAVGTPGYMAPEQLAGAAVDARADVFAFGVLAWELATGEHPFGSDARALLARLTEMIDGRPAPLTRPLPVTGLDIVARRCLRPRPEERYRDGGDLLTDVRALAEGRPPAAPAGRDGALWWWQFHQAALAALATAMPIAAWFIRAWPERPYGSWIFYAVLALATVSVTLRLNLVFTSRVHAEMLPQQRARAFPAIAAADTLLAATLALAAAAIAGTHDDAGGLLVVIAVVLVASLLLVEPATTRAAGLTRRRR